MREKMQNYALVHDADCTVQFIISTRIKKCPVKGLADMPAQQVVKHEASSGSHPQNPLVLCEYITIGRDTMN